MRAPREVAAEDGTDVRVGFRWGQGRAQARRGVMGSCLDVAVGRQLARASPVKTEEDGAAATLKVGGNIVTNNVTGVASSGGTLQSFKNDMIIDNGVDGTPITAVPGYSGTLQ